MIFHRKDKINYFTIQIILEKNNSHIIRHKISQIEFVMEFYKILIVEDDLILGSTLKKYFEVIHMAFGKEAIDVYKNRKSVIVLLDVKPPDIIGRKPLVHITR